jgi:hypothetical protein
MEIEGLKMTKEEVPSQWDLSTIAREFIRRAMMDTASLPLDNHSG